MVRATIHSTIKTLSSRARSRPYTLGHFHSLFKAVVVAVLNSVHSRAPCGRIDPVRRGVMRHEMRPFLLLCWEVYVRQEAIPAAHMHKDEWNTSEREREREVRASSLCFIENRPLVSEFPLHLSDAG